MKRGPLLIILLGLAALFVFQTGPAKAQDSGNPYIDALATQAALNTQATLAAYQGQQSAAGSANAAAAAQSQAQAALAAAAQAQAQAAYAAQQATQQAGQQQAALASAQSTADAAALQATAIVQQTRTALEVKITEDAIAADRARATVTQQAVIANQTRVANQNNLAATATSQSNNTMATQAAISLSATQTAIQTDQRTTNDSVHNQQLREGAFTALIFVVIAVACFVISQRLLGALRTRSSADAGGLVFHDAPLPASETIVDNDGAVVSTAIERLVTDDERMRRVLNAIYEN
jgi:hypothetical protein